MHIIDNLADVLAEEDEFAAAAVHLFAGAAGLRLLSASFAQTAEVLLYIARDLAVTIAVALRLRSRVLA